MHCSHCGELVYAPVAENAVCHWHQPDPCPQRAALASTTLGRVFIRSWVATKGRLPDDGEWARAEKRLMYGDPS
jgi:hypothetical protein